MSDYGLNNLMVTAAHRYCLGRATYINSECVEWLIRIWPQLDKHTKSLIKKETLEAIESERYGMQQDKEQWQKILDLTL